MSGARRSGAIALTLAAGGAAALALASAADRASTASPALAASIPSALRGNAWRTLAFAAVQTGDRATARAAATRAVLADPLDAGSSSALGMARLASGDAAGSAAAFRVAGRLGWRDQPTQLYWALAALQAGDQRVAVERTDALLRQDPTLPSAANLLTAIAARPAGRRALAERLAARPPWFGPFWHRLEGMSPAQLESRAAVLDEPALRPARLRCDELRPLSAALAAASSAGRGRAILKAHCATRGDGPIDDAGFERARLDAKSPFGWQFVGEGGLDVRLGSVAGFAGQALSVSSALPVRRVFATQMLELAPGRYELSWRARSTDWVSTTRVLARLACRPGSGAFTAARRAGDDRFATVLSVPTGCPTPSLELAIEPGADTIALDDLAIARLG